MADERGLLRLGPDHDPGRVAQEEQREVEGVAQLHEAGRLVGAVGVDRAGEVHGVVGDHAHRAPFDADQRGDHAEAEVRAQLEHRPDVGDRVDGRPHVVHLQAVLRDHVARRPAGGGAVQSPVGPWKYERYCRATWTAAASSATATSTTPLGTWTSSGPIASGREDAETAALDHRRSAHADVRALGRDHDVAAPEQGRVPGEAAAAGDADERHQPREPAEQVEGEAVEARHAGAVGVARTTAAALGEEHDREPLALGHLEEPVLLAMVLQALGARQHGVVVRHHHDRVAGHRPDRRRSSRRPVSARSGPGARAGGAARRSRAGRTRRACRRSRRSSTFSPRRSLSGAPAALDRVRPGGVETDRVTGAHLRQVVPLSRHCVLLRGAGHDGLARRQRRRARRRPARRRRRRTTPARSCPPRGRRPCAPSSSTRSPRPRRPPPPPCRARRRGRPCPAAGT